MSSDGPCAKRFKAAFSILTEGKADNCFNYKLLSVETNTKFRLKRYIYNLRFEDLKNCEDPRTTLINGLQHLIDAILSVDKEVTKLGVVLESSLLDYDATIPFTDIAQSLPELFGNMFYKMQQSAKLAPVFDAPFNISVITYGRLTARGKKDPLMGHIDLTNMFDVDFSDNYCLFYAIICAQSYATSQGKKKQQRKHMKIYKNPHKFKDQLQFQALDLINNCHIDPSLNGYSLTHAQKVQDYLKEKFGDKFCLLIFSTSNYTKPIFKGNIENPDFYLSLFWFQEHFYAIKNLGKFCSGKRGFKYCPSCQKVFRKNFEHRNNCPRRCSYCCSFGQKFPCEVITPRECLKCKRVFPSETCYRTHLKNFTCGYFIYCDECGTSYKTNKKQKHVCGDSFCQKCKTYHAKKDYCFIEPKKLSTLKEYRFVVFDFETTQDTFIEEGVFEHEVNYIKAHVFCTKCLESNDVLNDNGCNICGEQKRKTFSGIDDPDCLFNFVKWLIYELNPKFKTIALSHFGGRFDNVFVLKKLFNLNLNPNCIKNGNKFYEIHVEGGDGICDTSFKDSFNFMSLPLGNLVKTFNLNIQEKMFFPHARNKKAMYDVRLEHLPPKEEYFYNSMTKSKQKLFDEWYAKEYNTPFFLPDMLDEYCGNDVDILLHASIAFRKIFWDVAKIDPFLESCTCPGTCMKLYRASYLPKKTLAIVPEKGYQKHITASAIALKYLTWRAQVTGKNIQHRNTSKGEKRLGDYYVDGFIEEDNHVIEVLGCCWHGHLKCYQPDTWLPTHRTAAAEFARTVSRINKIKEMGFTCETVWVCDIEKQLKEDATMRKFFSELILSGPIDPREGFFGGRCNPHKIHAEKTSGRKLCYLDFTSLYPFTNIAFDYPIAIPEIVDISYDNQTVLWTNPSDNPYKGLLNVFIVPPYKLLAPVVPLKLNDFLLFPLCKACAVMHLSEKEETEHLCTHVDSARGWIATITHLELNLALKKGYKVTKLFTVYNFKQWSNTLFKKYIQKFLTLKVQSDGWPPNVKTETQKRNFIKEYKELFGVVIDYDKVLRNPGLRYIAKLCLNSLWGKFGMRNTLSKCKITEDPLEVDKLINSDKYTVKSIDLLNKNQVMIVYDKNLPFIVENTSSNLLISLFTTSFARITLYKAMDKVINTPNCFLIYTDTDSLIFECPEDVDPLPTGNYLGDLTDEIGPDEELIEVIVAGPKQYALKIRNKITGEITYKMVFRGITMDAEASETLHYEFFKKMVLEENMKGRSVELSYRRIIPNRLGTVISKDMPKTYTVVYKKGFIGTDGIYYPYGYKK